MRLRLLPSKPDFDIIRLRYAALIFSILLVGCSAALVMMRGLNFGIDFAGGTVIEIVQPEGKSIADLRESLSGIDAIDGDPQLQEFSAPGGLSANVQHVLIRISEQSPRTLDDGSVETSQDANDRAIGAVGTALGDVTFERVEFVGPAVGEELKRAALMAILLSLGGILLYIWLRFEWQFGVAAVVALAHDAIATVGLFAVTQLEFNLASLAAVLMVAGYSINDTVVVFDRVRENLRKFKRKTLGEILNVSINDTLSRTVMTSITTLLALVALWVFGGDVIRGFSVALIWGIVIGTYSSIFVAVPFLLLMRVKRSVLDEDKSTDRFGGAEGRA